MSIQRISIFGVPNVPQSNIPESFAIPYGYAQQSGTVLALLAAGN